MQAPVLPDWMKTTADTIDRAFNSSNGAQAPRQRSQELLLLTRGLYRGILVLREAIVGEIAQGVEATAFVAEYGPVADSLTLLLEKVRVLAEKTPGKVNERLAQRLLARLRRIEDNIVETRNYLAKFLAIAKAPPPPIDWEKVRRGSEDAAAGRVEDGQAILKRLQAGGDI